MTSLPRPLPVRPRPRPGETTASYITLLADANHIPEGWLRRALSRTPRPGIRPDLGLLAAASGRTPAALQHALADLSCEWCGTPLNAGRRSGPTARWCSLACKARADRERARSRPAPVIPPGVCKGCGRTFERPRGQRGRAAEWCSPGCWRQDYYHRARRAAAKLQPARPCIGCGGPVRRPPRGRLPEWCSPGCRQQHPGNHCQEQIR